MKIKPRKSGVNFELEPNERPGRIADHGARWGLLFALALLTYLLFPFQEAQPPMRLGKSLLMRLSRLLSSRSTNLQRTCNSSRTSGHAPFTPYTSSGKRFWILSDKAQMTCSRPWTVQCLLGSWWMPHEYLGSGSVT